MAEYMYSEVAPNLAPVKFDVRVKIKLLLFYFTVKHLVE